MRLLVVGSGSAFSAAGFNASYCLDGRLLVDCGAPVHKLLPDAGVPVEDVRILLVTHFHFDHTGMAPLLLGTRALATDPVAPLTVAGPPGTLEYLLRLLRTGYGSSLEGTIAERLRPGSVVLQDGSDVDVGGYRIRAAAVVHSTGPSLAYAVTGPDGATVGFSGDTTLCAGVRRIAAMSDLMVVECTGWDGPVSSHMWAEDIRELLAELPGTRFLVSHLVDRRVFDGALVAHDRLALDVLPAGAALPDPPPALRAG